MKAKRHILPALVLAGGLLLLGRLPVSAQEYDDFLSRGDSLHRAYQFEDALSQYMTALRRAQSLDEQRKADRRIDAAQNALSMTNFCSEREVIARQRFSREDFFLVYPMQNKAWRVGANPLDSLGSMPMYLPDGEESVVFPLRGPSGEFNLNFSRKEGTVWTFPEPLDEQLLSPGNEIFPVLSPDGNTLWFSSDALAGMGGYDLYVSHRDPESGHWGAPENLGIPFSSPGDDFLMVHSDDGKYTLFASNRDCSQDSVYVYVLEYDPLPLRTPIHSPEALRQLSALRPSQEKKSSDLSSPGRVISENDNTRLYRSKTDQARSLRDSIYRHERDLDALRGVFPQADAATRESLTHIIGEKEDALIPLRQRLEEIGAEIHRIEQSFLRGGAAKEVLPQSSSGAADRYTFRRNAPGGPVNFQVDTLRTLPGENYAISSVGHLFGAEEFPLGELWQIRLFSSVRHATLEDIQGLDPVFERLSSNLQYTCYYGVFRSYASALRQLNLVRSLGFREAKIVHWQDGKIIQP